jgi:hypothetical protein
MNARNTHRIWAWPIMLALASAAGLTSALLADGWVDALSWFGLGLPVLVACVKVLSNK